MAFRFRKPHRRPPITPQLFHPRLEPLEDRRLLAAAPLHVDIDSTAETPDGTSWATAYVSLQDALDQAATLNNDPDPENNIDQIWIAEGTYTPTALSDADLDGTIDTDPRSATFSLIDGVSLYGGFAGTETTLAERQTPIEGNFPHETILTGDLVGNDASGIAAQDLLAHATRQDNAYTIVTAIDLMHPTTLDGLAITGGNANVSDGSGSSPSRSGGGIYSNSNSLALMNLTILGNTAYVVGGGVFNDGVVTVTNVTITSNQANAGGGISNDGTSIVTNSIIWGNSASSGGGIWNASGTLTVINSTVSDNSANVSGGGIYGGSVWIVGSTIAGNSAGDRGGGIYSSNLTVTDSTISNNWAKYRGGGIHCYRGSGLTVTNSTISDNWTMYSGGGICSNTKATLIGLTISGNSAGDRGGGILVESGTLSVTNSTISGNLADFGGGIHNDSGTLTVASSTISGNSADDEGGGINKSDGTLTVTNSIVAINRARSGRNIRGSMAPDSSFNLIDVDPGFIHNPGPGTDAIWGTEDDDPGVFHLRFDSPAINAGNRMLLPTDTFDLDDDSDTDELIPFDFEGGPRIEGDEVDIGAREGVGEAPGAIIAISPIYRVGGYADVLFDGARSYDPNGDSLTYLWQIDFDGNGTYDDPGETVSTAASFEYTFSNGGVRRIQLTVSDGEHSHATMTSLIVLSAPILLVDHDDATEWNEAFDTIQLALDTAASRNVDADMLNDIASIWIADGTYVPTALSDANGDGTIDDDPRSATFSLVDGVSLFGGFTGNETRLDQREWTVDGRLQHETILSGDLGRDDSADIATPDLLTHATRDDNAYTVVTAIALTRSVTLDGITIRGGNANSDGNSTAMISGGGILNLSSRLTVTNSTIPENAALSDGGGICNTGSAVLIVIDTTISGNASAEDGGAICNYNHSTLTLLNSMVSGNRTANGGGGVCNSLYGEADIVSSTISGNQADYGGGIYDGGGTYGRGEMSITNSTISGNSADHGGGVYCGGKVAITNSTIAGNSAYSRGGGIYNSDELIVTNSIVALNGAASGADVGRMAIGSGFNLIGADPAFVRSPGPGADGVWGTEDDDPGDLRLTDRSPAVNAGSNVLLPEELAVDLDGNPRIFGLRADIGAYEYQADPAPDRELPSTIVTTVADTFDLFDSLVSLREAVWYADLDGSTVTFDSSLDGQEIVLAGTAIDLDRSVTIDASDVGALTINGDGRSGVFVASSTNAVLIGLTITGGYAGAGGGIANYGELSVINSVISGNSTRYYGGGIFNYYYGTLTVGNSTISGNSAGLDGGGIWNNGGDVTVRNSTISGNSAHSGGGIYNVYATVTAHNTIVAGNSAANAETDVYNYDGSFADSSSYNLIGVGNAMLGISHGVNGNLVGTAADPIDPRLGPLGDYGGPMWTMPLLAGSPAIDRGDPAVVDPPLTDQRGGVRIVDGDGDGIARIDIGAFEYSPGETLLLDRRVFYGNSAFEGDDAIATDKRALRAGERASFANHTSYDKGINGIVVDVAALADPGGVSAADFSFRVGNDSAPSGWAVGPDPTAVEVRVGAGVGGADRVEITWQDYSIVNEWLQVTVRANGRTGLVEDDVFYFGNAVGEAGDNPKNAIVNATDEIVARNFQHSAVDRALIDDPYDYNRDGLVNGTDQVIARNNRTNPLAMLRLIEPPVEQVEAVGQEMPPVDFDWLHEFEQVTAKREPVKRSAVEAAVDRLLAVEGE